MELELALLDEGTDDLSARAAIKRLRDAGAGIGRLIQALSSKYGLESCCVIPAVQLAERWSASSRQYAMEIPIAWTISLDRENLFAEAGLIRSLLEDLLDMAIRLNRKKPLQVNCHSKEGRVLFEILAPEGQPPNNAVIDAHQPYWTALTHLAERCQGVLTPAKLTVGSSFPMMLSLPVQTA